MTFPVPDYAFGDGRGLRVSASDVAGLHGPFTCRMGVALTARKKVGRLQPNPPSWRKNEIDPAFTLNFAIRDIYDAVIVGADADALVASEPNLTHHQRRFVRHAIDQLAELLPTASASAGTELTLEQTDVATSRRMDDTDVEVTVFGRHLKSADHRVHEVVRFRMKQLPREERDSDRAWTAVAALTLAYSDGVPSDARVRVSEFSLADGEYRVTFDGSRADTAASYERAGKPLRDALTAGPYSPGSACAKCAFLDVCPALPKRRGVVGIPGRAVVLRALTSADLAAYVRCPTAFAAQRRDHLPDAYADDADPGTNEQARERGKAVHRWLDWAHSRVPTVPCAEEDLPEPSTAEAADVAAAARLTADEYAVAYSYLRHHLERCPCGFDGLENWATERRVTFYDEDADLVVVSTPDLTCQVSGTAEPIWRETKTAKSLPPDVDTALELFPAFALNVAMLNVDVPGRFPAAHAELEVLTPSAGEIFRVSSGEGDLVVHAQKLVAENVRAYAADLTFGRNVGGGCRSCSMHRWCDPPLTAAEAAAVAPVVDDDEFAEFDDPF